tara:strand:- start:2082 stop:2444 length:363 start_codon:yes stop_codon:yes gene_type:complete
MKTQQIPIQMYWSYLTTLLCVLVPALIIQWPGLNQPYTHWRETIPDDELTEPWSFQLDINTATTTEFDLLTGVGTQLAKRIIKTRESLPNRRFTRIDELLTVHGIGEKTLARLRPHLICN